MYAMTGAHTTLPIPSYVKVTNLSNKRSVIVRINDRGPFKRDRLIDLSYAAAHKLRLIEQGSGMVEVEWIDTSPEALKKMQSTSVVAASKPAETKALAVETAANTQTAEPVVNAAKATVQNDTENNSTYYVQVGAFKNETNGDLLQKKVISLDLAGNAAVTKVYNNGVYRVKLGPFPTRKEADISANKVRKQLNTSAIVTNQ
jgi:rare lipoprotein A